MSKNEMMVSISCITYNHEKYISDAIESFLMQKTNFPFEILIHDDASTDRTPDIIKEYELKYPDLIKPIYQKENQYSKGVKVSNYNWKRAKGKYIAVCEGDDYWTDPYKLQKQVYYMEKNPECSLCVNATYKVKPDKAKIKPHIRPNLGNKIYTVEEVILGGGGLFATNSMLYPAALKNSIPDFYRNAPVGDYPLAIYLALNGTVYYLDEFMSAYRANVPGSWTNSMSSSIDERVSLCNSIADMLNEVNLYTDFKYDTVIKETIKITTDKNLFNIMLEQGLYKEVKEGELQYIYSSLRLTKKIKVFFKQYFPRIAEILIKIKRLTIR
jgi:glycosyltransferase involved in cell wall biosynthesis